MSRTTIYGVAGSPYVRSAALGLEEKGVPYEFSAMTAAERGGEEHLRRHPFARMPVLDHGDFRLYETQAILRYVDRTFPGVSLRPADAKAAARMDQIVGIVDWYFFHHITVPITVERLGILGRPADEATVAKAVPAARTCVRELARLKGDAPFIAGETLSIADLMLAPQLAYFVMMPEGEMVKGTSLMVWLDRMKARPSWQATERERLQQAA